VGAGSRKIARGCLIDLARPPHALRRAARAFWKKESVVRWPPRPMRARKHLAAGLARLAPAERTLLAARLHRRPARGCNRRPALGTTPKAVRIPPRASPLPPAHLAHPAPTAMTPDTIARLRAESLAPHAHRRPRAAVSAAARGVVALAAVAGADRRAFSNCRAAPPRPAVTAAVPDVHAVRTAPRDARQNHHPRKPPRVVRFSTDPRAAAWSGSIPRELAPLFSRQRAWPSSRPRAKLAKGCDFFSRAESGPLPRSGGRDGPPCRPPGASAARGWRVSRGGCGRRPRQFHHPPPRCARPGRHGVPVPTRLRRFLSRGHQPAEWDADEGDSLVSRRARKRQAHVAEGRRARGSCRRSCRGR